MYITLEGIVKRRMSYKEIDDNPHYIEFKNFYDDIQYKKLLHLKNHVIKILQSMKPNENKLEVITLMKEIETYMH